jgi:hypothetical protein
MQNFFDMLRKRHWLKAIAAFACLAFHLPIALAADAMCLRDVYTKPQLRDACDPLYASNPQSLSCVHRQCPAELPHAHGAACLSNPQLAQQPGVAQELVRLGVDVANSHIQLAAAIAVGVADKRQRGQAASLSAQEVMAERAAVGSLEAALTMVLPATAPSPGNVAQAMGASFGGQAGTNKELFTTKALRITEQADVHPPRVANCHDASRRPVSSAKTVPVVPSTPFALAASAEVKATMVWRPVAAAALCIGIRQGPVGYLDVSNCERPSGTQQVYHRRQTSHLTVLGLGREQCIRPDSNGALYASRCESAAPLPTWSAQAFTHGSQNALRLQADGSNQCMSWTKGVPLVKLAPCAASGAALDSQLWLVERTGTP